MRKIISICAFLILLFITLSTNCLAFTDIGDPQLEKQIEDLSALNIINGYEDGTFKPQKNITRAEFSKIIMEAIINNDVFDSFSEFNDVTSEHWAYNYIYKAKHLGIVNGTSDITFEPESNVTYEQAIKMIVCAIGYGEEALQEGGWPNGYIIQANKLGILENIEFKQNDLATRENIAKIVRNSLDVPFYYLKATDNGITREYSGICIFNIKNTYLNSSADDEYQNNTEVDFEAEDNFEEEKDSVG